MKKSLLVIALSGVFGVASAQSSLSVYGTVDAGVSYANGAKAAGNVTSLESGQQSYSRLGFKGTEDLGHGAKAFFVLEQGIQINTGSSGLATIGSNIPTEGNNGTFSSQAYLGLGNEFGVLKVGRQFTPLYEAYSSIDPFASGFAANINNFFGTDANNNSNYQRMSNAVVFSTPDNLYGFKGALAYGFGGVPGSTVAQRQIGASLGYVNGSLSVIYAHHQANNEQNNLGTSTETFKTNFIGAAYNFNAVKVHAAFDQNQQGNSFKTQNYLVGLTVALNNGNAVFADYTHKNYKYVDNSNADQYAIGYTYNLSKRTNFYAAYTYVKNQRNSTVATEVAGNSVKAVQAGIRHSF